ncbi:unnamed protein product [Ectocarpus sp. 13 AM-2016]
MNPNKQAQYHNTPFCFAVVKGVREWCREVGPIVGRILYRGKEDSTPASSVGRWKARPTLKSQPKSGRDGFGYTFGVGSFGRFVFFRVPGDFGSGRRRGPAGRVGTTVFRSARACGGMDSGSSVVVMGVGRPHGQGRGGTLARLRSRYGVWVDR